MINFPRQAYVNPFLSALNTPFGGVNPLALGQQMGGIVPAPFGYLPMTQFGQYNPLAAQVAAGIVPGINPVGFGQGLNAMTPPLGQYNPLQSQIGAGFNRLIQQQMKQFVQQQLPIRPLINSPQLGWGHSNVRGIAQGTQWPGAQVDPYRAFIEAQLIAQFATNPLYQLQHQLQHQIQPRFQQGFQQGYGGPEGIGFGAPLGTGQQFNPLYGNVPFCG